MVRGGAGDPAHRRASAHASPAVIGHWRAGHGRSRRRRNGASRAGPETVSEFHRLLKETLGAGEAGQILDLLTGEDDDPAEQSAIRIRPDVAAVVVERPGAHHVIVDVVGVGPLLPRADLVRSATVPALRAHRPGAIRVDPIAEAVHM